MMCETSRSPAELCFKYPSYKEIVPAGGSAQAAASISAGTLKLHNAIQRCRRAVAQAPALPARRAARDSVAPLPRHRNSRGLTFARPVHDIRQGSHAFNELAICIGESPTPTGRDQPERVEAIQTSSSLLQLFGAQPFAD